VKIEPVVDGKFSDLLVLNNASLPHVNLIDLSDMQYFYERAEIFNQAITDQGTLAGFVIAMTTGKSYKSINYQWFVDKFASFLYIDRIIVASSFRRDGVAQALYQGLIGHAKSTGIPMLTCEVNRFPANPASLALHEKLGFRVVGTQLTEQGQKEVLLMVLDLHA
jgi:uncharacterized protein